MGKRERTALLDEQFDDVAGEHEHKPDENGQVRRRQRIQHELSEEVRREGRGAARQREQAYQGGDEHGDARENQLGVVAERSPRRGRRARGGRSRRFGLRPGVSKR